MTEEARIELHGSATCPFTWYVRIAARLKGLDFDWVRSDADPSDPRRAHNTTGRTPFLYDGGFALFESGVIAAYIDESYAGPSLMPRDAKERARARLALVELDPLYTRPDPPPETRKAAEDALARLDAMLGDGRSFLNGDSPGLVDAFVWPGLHILGREKVAIPEGLKAAGAYWERSRAHDAYTATKPSAW